MKTVLVVVAITVLFAGAGTLAADDALPALPVETLITPVKTARMNSTALSLNPRGGWNFIAQFMNYKYTTMWEFERLETAEGRPYVAFKDTKGRPPAEWVVVDLTANTHRVFELPGFHGGVNCRAENGRIFFPVDFFQVWYYDPLTEEMKILGELREWKPFTNNRSIYRFQLGPDGYIYGTSQGYNGCTALVRINPDSLDVQVFTDVGTGNRKTKLTYGYYLGVDPPWAYVAVGQDEWELMAVNVETGEKRCLAQRSGKGARITVAEGDVIRAQLSGAPGREVVWCVDGAIIPAKKNPDGSLPYTPIPQKTYKHVEWKHTQPMPAGVAPEVDTARIDLDGNGDGVIPWRFKPADKAAAETAPWNTAQFHINHAEAAPVELFLPLPDGSILGTVYSYQGAFRYYPADGKLDYFGKHGPSGAVGLVRDGKAYFYGYPNVNLWEYDPAQPWTSRYREAHKHVGKPETNPWLIGYFGQGTTEAHHSRYIAVGPNNRLYILGHRERWSTGAGLGYYEFATKKKFGLGQAMKEIEPRGLVVLGKAGRVIVSGELRGKNADAPAELRVYDLDLNEVERLAVKPGLNSTGALYDVGLDDGFVGLIEQDKTTSFYLYDLTRKQPTRWATVDGDVGPLFQRPVDGSWWMVNSGVLCRFNTETLALTPVGRLERGLRRAAWVGDVLYGAVGGEIVRVTVK